MDRLIKTKGAGILQKCFVIMVLFFVGLVSNAQHLMDVIPPKTQNQTVQSDTSSSSIPAQSYQPEMATGMRSNGKIYVVVAVMTMILLGLFIYLFTLDKKITKLEKSDRTM